MGNFLRALAGISVLNTSANVYFPPLDWLDPFPREVKNNEPNQNRMQNG